MNNTQHIDATNMNNNATRNVRVHVYTNVNDKSFAQHVCDVRTLLTRVYARTNVNACEYRHDMFDVDDESHMTFDCVNDANAQCVVKHAHALNMTTCICDARNINA